MAGVNKVILVGNLGKDPQIRYLENGRAVANFTLATNEVYKDRNGQKVESTEWHNIVLWTPLAEIAEKFLKKGSQVFIEGKITNRSYDDKEGNKRYITEIVGRELTLLGTPGATEPGTDSPTGKSSSDAAAYGSKPTATEFAATGSSSEQDDLPF